MVVAAGTVSVGTRCGLAQTDGHGIQNKFRQSIPGVVQPDAARGISKVWETTGARGSDGGELHLAKANKHLHKAQESKPDKPCGDSHGIVCDIGAYKHDLSGGRESHQSGKASMQTARHLAGDQ